jgi:hypothetical protein
MAALGGAGLLALLIAAANAYILLGSSGEATDRVADVPPEEVAIVPGAAVQPDGKMSTMLADRVRQASRLWHAGKVEKILVSGDHHTWAYDEPDTMRKALVRRGVTPRDIFEDHAGFDTWATMVRARSIFNVKKCGRRHPGLPHAAGTLSRRRSRDPRHRPHRRPSPLGLPGHPQRSPRGPLAGEGDRRRLAGHAGDGGAEDPDPDHRRPRKLGPGAARRHASGRISRRLGALERLSGWAGQTRRGAAL